MAYSMTEIMYVDVMVYRYMYVTHFVFSDTFFRQTEFPRKVFSL